MVDRPPTIRDLVQDPAYRAYLKKAPKLPENLQWGFPWRLWVEVPYHWDHPSDTHWMTRKYHTYQEAWSRGLSALKQSQAVDMCVVSMRHFFEPPLIHTKKLRNRMTKQIIHQDIYWIPDPPFEWCWRCRRPTLFQYLAPDHHALKTQPTVSPESPYRCWYCGIRRVGMPSARHYNFHGGV